MKTRRELERTQIAERDNETWFLVVAVGYNKGDLGGRRGYYLHVAPEGEGKSSSGYTTRIFGIGTGARAFLQDAARFNAKELERITPPAELVEQLKARVLEQWNADEQRRVIR